MFRRPVLGRERHAPERRAGSGEFEADFSLARADGAKKHNLTLLLLQRSLVLHMHLAATDEPGLQGNQRAVSVDRQRCGILCERFALRVVAANAHAYLHQNALAAAARTGVVGNGWRLTHKTS